MMSCSQTKGGKTSPFIVLKNRKGSEKMKTANQNPKTTNQNPKATNQKRIKTNLHRITALLLAFLLATLIVAPTIISRADDDANSFDNFSFEGKISYTTSSGQIVIRSLPFYFSRSGHITIKTVKLIDPTETVYPAHVYVYAFSDDLFTGSYSWDNDIIDGVSRPCPNRGGALSCNSPGKFGNTDCYYASCALGSYPVDVKLSFPNVVTMTGTIVDEDALIGGVDLSKDDWFQDEDIAKLTPVRGESIGYLPRARYFDDRKKHIDPIISDFIRSETTSTIQWDSFQEPYTDIDNYYYVEVYAKLHYTLAHKDPDNSDIWKADPTSSVHMYQFKKFGEIKYVSERLVFSYNDPLDTYFQTLDVRQDASGNTVNSKSDTNIGRFSCYVSDYYVRLVHYDYDKEQLLCGGFTKLTIDDKGGCTSSQGDFSDNDPDDGDWNDDPDGENDKDWDGTGDEADPDDTDPDKPDFSIDDTDIFTLIYTLIKALLNFVVHILTSFFETFKSLLLLVGDFPSLCKHVFSFLPDNINDLLFLGFLSIILMRFLGR